MRPFRVVVSPPFLDDYLCFFQAVEDLTIEQFVPEAGIEAFTVSVFLWRTRIDLGGLGANSLDPASNSLSNKFQSVV